MEFIFPILFLFFVFISGVRILMDYERGLLFRLGRYRKTLRAGFQWIIPFVDKVHKISLRILAMDVPPQDVITKDNVSIKVNAVIYFRVMDPQKAVI